MPFSRAEKRVIGIDPHSPSRQGDTDRRCYGDAAGDLQLQPFFSNGNIDHIDAALMRSSRCFKIVHFTKLTQEEANKAAKALGVPKPTGKTHYALSEITAGLNPGNAKSIGFN